MIIPKGTVFEGPNGHTYEVIEDVDTRKGPMPSQSVLAGGGAEQPTPNTVMPEWLAKALWDASAGKLPPKREASV